MKTAASLLLLSLFFSSILLFASVNASTSYVCTGYPGNTLGNIACNPAPNANIIVTNTVIDVGQYSFITVNGISNSIGAAPLPL
ncbi:MAG: hypothetical protein KGH50_04785, partial [Candidatus Micrarchaeota archaeon]|nr:hypothetical protein [Candidatus Micrarchaeota archaeon]